MFVCPYVCSSFTNSTHHHSIHPDSLYCIVFVCMCRICPFNHLPLYVLHQSSHPVHSSCLVRLPPSFTLTTPITQPSSHVIYSQCATSHSTPTYGIDTHPPTYVTPHLFLQAVQSLLVLVFMSVQREREREREADRTANDKICTSYIFINNRAIPSLNQSVKNSSLHPFLSFSFLLLPQYFCLYDQTPRTVQYVLYVDC